MGKTSNHIQRNGKFFTGDLYSGKTTNRILEPIQPSINFDVTADWSYGFNPITDKSSFILFFENSGFINIVVENFVLSGQRITCFLSCEGTDLNIQDKKVVTVNSIGEITNLNLLNFNINDIVDFNLLVALPDSITQLYMNFNQIINFNPLIPLPSNLSELGLANNQIVDFNPSVALPSNLLQLVLSYNQIVDFNPTIALPNSMSELLLDNNQIANFDPLIPLPNNLGLLFLKNNEITSFSPSVALPSSLLFIYLDNNLINDWSDDSWVVNVGNNGFANLSNNSVTALGSAVHNSLSLKGWTVIL